MIAVPSTSAGPPDCVLHNGRLLTQDPALPRAEALAVRGGRILAVGSSAEILALASPSTKRIDLAQQTLIPGFNDAHVHVWKVGDLLTRQIDLRPIDSLEGIRRAIREADARLPKGSWILGRGFNEARLAEGRSPTKLDLDEAAKDRPIYLTRTCGHIAVASSRALQIANLRSDTPAPQGGVILLGPDGDPSGILHETAMGLVARFIPDPSAAELEVMILAAARHQLALGITSATDAGVMPDLLEVYRAMDARGALPYRVNVMALRRPLGDPSTIPLPSRSISPMLRVDTIKILADGGLSGATAALRAPYRDMDSCGLLRIGTEELVELTRDAHLAGLRVATHVIGDHAIDVVLSAYEELARIAPGPRHRLEHFGLPHPADLARAARIGAVAVPQAVFLHELGRNFRRYLPDDLLPRAYPLRDMLKAGLVVALSSDAPVVANDNPLLGIRSAILRRDAEGFCLAPEQAISAEEALYAYTMGGALASGDDDDRGSLTPGKVADMAVLSANPLEMAPEALLDIRAEMTFVGGSLAFEA